ncbi:hypothetical protein J7J60_01015 [bacterium]|nr:hypothetical protein [bacterium]
MKNRSKVGNQKGNPAFRTPSCFIALKSLRVNRLRGKIKSLRGLRNKKYGERTSSQHK